MRHLCIQKTWRIIATVIASVLLSAASSTFADNAASPVIPTENLHQQQTDTTDNSPPTPAVALTTEKKAGQGANRIGSGTHLASVAAGLLFIVVLILALGWFLRRFNQGGLFNNSSIKIIATMPMGTRERLAVVEVGGQQLLLGITATQINTLHVFAEPVIEPSANSPAASDFGKKLMAILQQKNTKDSSEPQDKSTV